MVFKNLETKSKRNLAVSVAFALSILAFHIDARGENIAGKEYTEAFVWTAPGGIGVNRGGVGDLDGDGRPELVLCYGSADTGGKVEILRISGSTLTTVQSISPPGAGQIRAFILNVDGQGLPELVTTTSALGGNASLAIYRYDGIEMAKLWEHGGFNGSTYADVGDTDNDGVPELVTAEATYGRNFRVWEPSGDFTSWSESFRDSAGIADCDFATVGDTDGDGQNEIFVNFRYWSPNEYRLYRYTGGTYQKIWSWQPPLGTEGGPTTGYMGDGAMGDFDGDGRKEMVMATNWYSPSHLKSYVFDWDGVSYQQVAIIDPDVSGTGYSNAWAGQLLGSDFDDVFSVTTSESYFYAFEAGSYTLKESLPGSLVAFGDLTKDGETELVVTVPDGQGGFKASVYSAGEPCPPPPPGPPWSFVHITDTHIGPPYENARDSLMAVVHDIKHFSSTPEFILVTGDISDVGCNENDGCNSLGNYSLFTDIMKLLRIDYYTIPGNHDRKKAGSFYQTVCANGLSCYEAEILGHQPTVNFFPQLSVENYWFEPAGKGHIFIGLDTGPENFDADKHPTDNQIEDLRWLGNNNKCTPKIVFMHHAAAGGGGEIDHDENKGEFLDWCDQNNVKVVITGHTHEGIICNRNGVKGWPVGETAYVQTPSCGKGDDGDRGYRIFDVEGGIVSARAVRNIQDILNKRYEVLPNSPVEVHVYDSQGQHVGVDPSGEIKEGEIHGSYYLPQCSVETEDGSDVYPEKIIIFDPTDDYLCEVVGTEEGTYGLNITLVIGGQETTFKAADIPTSPGARHVYVVDWAALSAGEEGVILNIDENGDGFFEQMAIADNELSYDEFALQTETVVDFDPDTLNLKSEGKFATVYIELPDDFDVSEIDVFSLELNELVPPLQKPIEIGDYDSDGINDLMVKFDRQEIMEVLETGEQIIDLTGRLWDGRRISGFDFIRVIH